MWSENCQIGEQCSNDQDDPRPTHHVFVVLPVGDDDADGRRATVYPVGLHRRPHGVLEQLEQDVVYM